VALEQSKSRRGIVDSESKTERPTGYGLPSILQVDKFQYADAPCLTYRRDGVECLEIVLQGSSRVPCGLLMNSLLHRIDRLIEGKRT